jgi:hypothetical protein
MAKPDPGFLWLEKQIRELTQELVALDGNPEVQRWLAGRIRKMVENTKPRMDFTGFKCWKERDGRIESG